MEKINYKNLLHHLILFFLILLIIGYNFYYFLIAPIKEKEARINYVLTQYDDEAIYSNDFLEYIVILDDNEIVFVNEFGQTIKRFNQTTQPDSIFEGAELSYGFHDDQLVYIFKNESEEVWIDANTSEILLRQEWD